MDEVAVVSTLMELRRDMGSSGTGLGWERGCVSEVLATLSSILRSVPEEVGTSFGCDDVVGARFVEQVIVVTVGVEVELFVLLCEG